MLPACLVFSSPHEVTYPPLPSPPLPSLLQEAVGWQICSEVHFATWRPTASLGQPIRGCEKQTPAPPLVHRSRELIPLSMAMSLCRLAVLKPIILPPFFVQTSFSPSDPLHAYKDAHTHTHRHTHTHTHTHTVTHKHTNLLRLPTMSQETEGVWESGDLKVIAMRRHYESQSVPISSIQPEPQSTQL